MKINEWSKSTRCASSSCAEVRLTDDIIQVRDSKSSGAGVLTFTRAEWAAFLGGVKDGEFDL